MVVYSPRWTPSAGGMEDASHSDPLGNQGIILLHRLLCLEDPHINALFLQVLHGGWWHLERRERDEQEGGKGSQRRLSCPKASVLHRIRQQWSLLSHPECRHSSMGQGAPVSFRKVSEELESQWFRVCACVWPSSLPIPGWEKQTTVTCPKGLIPTL